MSIESTPSTGEMPFLESAGRVPSTHLPGLEPCPECGKLLKHRGLPPHRAKVHGIAGKYASRNRARAPRAPRAAKPQTAEADPVVALMGELLDFSLVLLLALKSRHEAVRPLRLEYTKLRKKFTALKGF